MSIPTTVRYSSRAYRALVALCMVTLTLMCTARSHAADSDALARAIEPLITAHRGTVAVSVSVLDDNGQPTASWNYRGDEPMPTASLIKLPVMVETYRQCDEGRISLEDPLVLREEDKVPGSGILTDHLSAGIRMSLRDAVRLMIRYSDNTATNLVVDHIGIAATTETMTRMGFPETRLNAKVYRRDTSIDLPRSERFGLGSTTANDMVRILTLIEQRQMVSKEASEAMIEHLLACESTSRIPGQLPSDCRVAHKTGSVNSVRTDAGLVYFPGGRFALCILTDDNEDTRWTDDNAANVLCGAIARAVHDQLRTSKSPPTDAGPLVAVTLAKGAAGPMVETLQRTLSHRLERTVAVDGDFGPETEAAVKDWQRVRGLEPSGIVDHVTWKSLGSLEFTDRPVPPPAEVNAREHERTPAIDVSAPPEVTAKAWAILDLDSGKLLDHGKESNTRLNFASTTKVMTAYLVLRYAERHPEVLDEIVTFSRRADGTIGSTSGLRAGEQVPVGELLYGLMLPSGNDASVALAEHFGDRLDPDANGDQRPQQPTSSDTEVRERAHDRFVAAMNAAATELGLEATHYCNPHGLTEAEHLSTAADLARLAYAAWQLPRMREIVGCREHGCQVGSLDGYTRNVAWTNTNRLLGQEGFLGMKTGTTDAAGACLIAVGERDGAGKIIVVLGSVNSDARYVDARNLFAWVWR